MMTQILTKRRCLLRLLAAPLVLSGLLSCLCLAAARADAPTGTVVIGGRTVPFGVSPFVGGNGDLYAPVDAVRVIGGNYTPNAGENTVTAKSENGRSITVPYLAVDGRYCVALQRVMEALGATADWQPATRTLTVRAKLEMVRQDGGDLSIFTSYPVYYSVKRLKNPERLYVDLHGLDLAAAPATIPVSGGSALRIRSGQLDPQTVRIAIDLKRGAPFKILSPIQTNRVQVALGPGAASPVRRGSPLPAVTPRVAVIPAPAVSDSGLHITSVSYKTVSDSLSQIAIATNGSAQYRTEALDSPSRITFDLPGAVLDAAVKPSENEDSPVIKAIRTGILKLGDTQFGRVVVDLSRMVGFSVTTEPSDSGTVYLINLQTPHHSSGASGNSLAGKVVVVDPGHGAQDSGAIGIRGVREKDLNLAIGLKLRDCLRDNGATVYMTRDTDNGFLPVNDRPRYAVKQGADYFISVHCNDGGARNSHSGTTVYYHMQNASCRRMALDILQRVAEVSGIPAIGARSDSRLYQSGLGVLRGSPMPAVLIECGFVNSTRDVAKLIDAATQQHIAEGITAGLRDFVADSAAP